MLLAAQVGPDYPPHTPHMQPAPAPIYAPVPNLLSRCCNFSREPAAFGAIYDASLRAFLLCLYFDTHAKRIIPGNSQQSHPGQPYPHHIPPSPSPSIPSCLAAGSDVADLIICCRSSVSFPFSSPPPALDSFEKPKRKQSGKVDCKIPRNKLPKEKQLERVLSRLVSGIACLRSCCEHRVGELIICPQQQNTPLPFWAFRKLLPTSPRLAIIYDNDHNHIVITADNANNLIWIT